MYDAGSVSCTETGADLQDHVPALIKGKQATRAQAEIERLTADVLHGDELEPLRVGDVVDARHVGVADQPGELDLAIEPGRATVALSVLAHELERHVAAELDDKPILENLLDTFGKLSLNPINQCSFAGLNFTINPKKDRFVFISCSRFKSFDFAFLSVKASDFRSSSSFIPISILFLVLVNK